MDLGRLGWTGFSRLAVGLVFALNVTCAVAFLAQPDQYAPGFEVTGLPGRTVVQGFGILFLMWNVTYPPVFWRPRHYRLLFGLLLLQQFIGLTGETWLWLALPPEHTALRETGLRFIVFDGGGLVLMAAAYAGLQGFARRSTSG